MKKGSRSKKKMCLCGCGEVVQPYLKTNGRVNIYPKYVPGHGYLAYSKALKERYATEPHPLSRAIGSRRKHKTRELVYWQVKLKHGGRWAYEHRKVAETKIGRKLSRHEHVHHINEDTLDNRPENLEVLTISEHNRHHSAIREALKCHTVA